MSSNDFLYASIHNVIKTLIEAILLVILVVYFFLQDFRSTLVPFVGIIVSLVGTFAFMSLMGFSLNLITLFALVLVIGTVVDDSIISWRPSRRNSTSATALPTWPAWTP